MDHAEGHREWGKEVMLTGNSTAVSRYTGTAKSQCSEVPGTYGPHTVHLWAICGRPVNFPLPWLSVGKELHCKVIELTFRAQPVGFPSVSRLALPHCPPVAWCNSLLSSWLAHMQWNQLILMAVHHWSVGGCQWSGLVLTRFASSTSKLSICHHPHIDRWTSWQLVYNATLWEALFVGGYWLHSETSRGLMSMLQTNISTP